MTGWYAVGIDPSLSGTGIAQADGLLMTIKTHAKPGRKNNRLQTIHKAAFDAAGGGHWAGKPALVMVEDLPTHAKSAGLTGQAQGVVRLALVDAGVSMMFLAPATLKKFATGKGNADKAAMIAAWNARNHARVTDDNQADAAWLRQYGRTLMHIASHQTVHLPLERQPKSFEDDIEMARRILAGDVFQ